MIIKRKYYTDYEELDQREFGIVSDLYHSTPKKVYKKYAGRARVKVANGLEKQIEKNQNKHDKAVFRFMRTMQQKDGISSPEIMKNLIKNNREKTGARVFKLDFGTGPVNSDNKEGLKQIYEAILNNEQLSNNKLYRRIGKKLKNSALKDKAQIYLPDGSGAEYLAHEIGHTLNRYSKGIFGKLKRKIHEVGTRPDVRTDYSNASMHRIDVNNMGKMDTIKEIGRRLKNGTAINLEEIEASRKGLKELKKAGANKEQIKRAKKNLKDAYDTYKYQSRVYVLDPISQKIQIPSRRAIKKGENLS